MALNDVKVTVLGGGLGRREPSQDMICGIITTGVAVSGGLALDTSYKLYSMEDLESLGVDAAYDTANAVLLYHHVSEFFRMNPNGQLWLRVTGQATATLSKLVDVANPHAKQLLIDANGEIRVLGAILNPDEDYEEVLALTEDTDPETPPLVYSKGMDLNVFLAITKAQQLAESEFELHRPVAIVLEGRAFNGTAADAASLRTLDAEYVAVCIAQDKTVADGNALYASYAAVGTLLGTVSAAKVNENVAWVRKFPITSVLKNRFINAALSSGNIVSSYSDTSLGLLNDKGYIFARPHIGFAGFWWNDSSTCTAISSDFAYLENVRTIQKAARIIRRQLLPDLNSPLAVDPESGQLDATTCKYFEAQGAAALGTMVQDNEVTGIDVYVDPAQNVLSSSKLVAKFTLVPYGTARQIEGQVGFDNPLNS